MYRNCIFCSSDLGANEALEQFPVGIQVSFDPVRGRLWAVCPACARWNLAPIEERWEPVEQAEKLFRDARLRVQSQNIGLAKLPDGTRLVRVGDTVGSELAAWRYGPQLLRRRRRYIVGTAAAGLAGLGFVGGVIALTGAGAGFAGIGTLIDSKLKRRVVHRLRIENEELITIRRWHLPGMHLEGGFDDEPMRVIIRDARRQRPVHSEVRVNSQDIAIVTGDAARDVLRRVMPRVNKSGATQKTLRSAEQMLEYAGSADAYIRQTVLTRPALGTRAGKLRKALHGAQALAFEMALNEQAEREALEGELAALERAWKEAEEVAAIADSLPGEVLLNRLLRKLGA